jgi:isoleucyl-tRNA synthetase
MSKQWFFKVDAIKEKMIKENQKVRWLPDWGKERFNNWLLEAIDWCISQQRYWAMPLPVWICSKCNSMEVIGSVDELRKRSVKKLPDEFDLHKHVVDTIELKCGKCRGMMKRVPDTMNVWFDSGISTWASLGYPFSNKELFKKLWPADFITESQDQIRGWFYSLMFCGTATFGQSPYKSVGLMGWVLDEKGEKMSKSLGNVVWAKDGLEKLGADVLRMYYCWEVSPWEVQNFSFKTAEEIKKALNILWNSYAFFTSYCTPNFRPKLKNLRKEDKWILSRTNSLMEEFTGHLENFEFHQAGRKIVNFVLNDLSRFYIKVIRDRVWVSEAGQDKLTALSTLHEVLTNVIKLISPICPFVSEEIYQNISYKLNSRMESVHLCPWPKPSKRMIDKKLEESMEIVKKIIDASYSARQAVNLKLRWPIKQVLIISNNKKAVLAVNQLKDVLLHMCNCKDVKVVNKKPEGEFSEVEFEFGKVLIDKKLDEKLLEEALFRELVREIQSMRKENGFNVKEKIALTLSSDEQTKKLLNKYTKLLGSEVGAKTVETGKLEGKFKGQVKFEDKTIEIAFEKL